MGIFSINFKGKLNFLNIILCLCFPDKEERDFFNLPCNGYCVFEISDVMNENFGLNEDSENVLGTYENRLVFRANFFLNVHLSSQRSGVMALLSFARFRLWRQYSRSL